MKTIVIYALALATLANGQTGTEVQPNVEFEARPSNSHDHEWRDTRPTQICIPDTIKSLDCNTCICLHDGLNWGCTLMACPPKDYDHNSQSRNKRGTEVQPNVEFEARPSDSHDHEWRDTRSTQRCTPGSIKSLDCNRCFCSPDGSNWGCTLMACPPKDYDHNNRSRNKREIEAQLNDELKTSPQNPYDHLFRNRRPTQVCEPRTSKYVDCNSCFCLDDGSGWACTEMACPPKDSDQNN